MSLTNQHTWIEVGSRRWAMCCNHFQRKVRGQWRDDPNLTGPYYPRYEPTTEKCPALEQYELQFIGSMR